MSENTTGSVDTTGNPSQTTTDTTTAADAKWYSNVQDADLRGFAELKGWDSPDKALNSYRNLEKFQGLPPERLAKIPEQADAAGWAEFNKRFGWSAPEKAEDYGLKAPEGMPSELLGPLAEKLLGRKVPAEMAKGIVDDYYAIMAESMKGEDTRLDQANANETVQLKSEWGANYDQLAQLADRAQTEFGKKAGISDDHMALMREAMGPRAFNKLWAEIGSAVGEAKFVEGGSVAPTAMTPEAAQARLNQLGQDREWFKRYEAGGIPERQEFSRLMAIKANAAIAPH